MEDYKEYYCRTENGIKKIQKYEKRPQYENCHCIWFVDNDYGTLLTDEELEKMKPSETLIDLIEVGDYVNGKRVEWIGYKLYQDNGKECKGIGDKIILFNEFTKDYISEKNIKSIVTKEQFDAMKYEVK